jgi:hypothetical protein
MAWESKTLSTEDKRKKKYRRCITDIRSSLGRNKNTHLFNSILMLNFFLSIQIYIMWAKKIVKSKEEEKKK